MALSLGNVCLHRTNLGLQCIKIKALNSLLNKNSVRYLRGSRIGKKLSKDEIKYRNLLKTLKDENKPVTYDSGNIPVGEITSPHSTNAPTNIIETIDVSTENLYKRLEGKITPLKDIAYNRQLEKKYNKSLALLRVFGQKLGTLKVPINLGQDFLPCPVDLTIPSPVVESYRNQDEFSIGLGLDENPKTVGFIMGSVSGDPSNVVCMSPDELIIIRDSHKEFLKDFQNYLKESPLDACMKIDEGGHWRGLKIRSNLADELMAQIILHPQDLSNEELHKEGEKLKEYFSISEKPYNLKSLYFQVCSQLRCDTNEANLSLLFGEPFLHEISYKQKLQISPNSYFPTNTRAMDCVYESLLKLCRVRENTTVLDIFCGTGSLSLIMSPHVQRCIGIDSCSSSIKDAKQNAILNNKHNVEFLNGNIEYMINEILSKDYYEDLIVFINPSRADLNKTAMKTLRACKFLKKIVYLTTKPKTAADHFIRLCKPCGAEKYLGKYFVPILAVPVDLFPQTDHFGLIVMFQRL